MKLQSSIVRSKRKGYAGAGVSTGGTRNPTPKSENRKGNERRFFFYAGQLITDHDGGHKRGRDSPPSRVVCMVFATRALASGGRTQKAAGRERVVTRGRGTCHPSVLLPPREITSYHKKVTGVSIRPATYAQSSAPVTRLLLEEGVGTPGC
jgi:hypothetical protein